MPAQTTLVCSRALRATKQRSGSQGPLAGSGQDVSMKKHEPAAQHMLHCALQCTVYFVFYAPRATGGHGRHWPLGLQPCVLACTSMAAAAALSCRLPNTEPALSWQCRISVCCSPVGVQAPLTVGLLDYIAPSVWLRRHGGRDNSLVIHAHRPRHVADGQALPVRVARAAKAASAHRQQQPHRRPKPNCPTVQLSNCTNA
jgi:hypothetical protein